ncbi:MAG TPA: sortase [Candidatus Paceibacterota bacterium]|nr:sortase [Candidatus Paceibacterota bacterium]HRZ34579.1 sortase [Candidatus Paceibacterota bacterium]
MIENTNHHKQLVFLKIFLVVFVVSLVVFSLSGLAPKSLSLYDYFFHKAPGIIGQPFDYSQGGFTGTYTRPDEIIISKLGIGAKIQQPDTFNVAELDVHLSQGPVHYPGSGSVENGNIFIFGHSADLYLNAQGSALKVFNNLYKLDEGDVIQLIANGSNYFYKVTKVSLVDENEALIKFNSDIKKLTISTCNTFGAREERWIVEAEAMD